MTTPTAWHRHAARTLEREQRREPPPTPEGEITVQSALEGMARIGKLLREGLDPQSDDFRKSEWQRISTIPEHMKP